MSDGITDAYRWSDLEEDNRNLRADLCESHRRIRVMKSEMDKFIATEWIPWPNNRAPDGEQVLLRYSDGSVGLGHRQVYAESEWWAHDDERCDGKEVVALARLNLSSVKGGR